MANDTRSSLTKTIESRYATQRCGGAFDVKQTLSSANTKTGKIIDALSLNATKFQSPAGFEVQVGANGTQFKDAQSSPSKELSVYMRGFSNKKYKK